MAGQGEKTTVRSRASRVRLLIAGGAFLLVMVPTGSSALDINDTVCTLRSTLSILLEPCPEEPAPPQTTPTEQPRTTNPRAAVPATPDIAAPIAPAKQGRSARAEANDTPQSLPSAQPPKQDGQVQPPKPVPDKASSESRGVPAWRDGLAAGSMVMISGLLMWLLFFRPRQHRDDQTAMDQLKRDLVSNLTHELRTPLTPVKGYAQLLAGGRLKGAQVRKVAAQMMDASQQLERRIDALVTYATLSRGGFSPGTDSVDISTLVHDIAGRRGEFRTTVCVDRSLPAIRADERLVRVAIQELLDNALKFSPGGEGAQIEVTRSLHKNREAHIEVSVADRGIGLDSADLAAAFEEFKQLDATSTRQYGGIGLGLTLADQIARLHGGEVRGTSAPGHGSVFTFSIPERLALSSAVPVHAAA